MSETIELYTHGVCDGNPGTGGYGAVLSLGANQKEVSGGYRHTTSGRMQLMAVIEGMKALKKPCTVTIFTHAQYVALPFTQEWVKRWIAHDWQKSDGQPVRNQDLWHQLIASIKTHQQVTFKYTDEPIGGLQQATELARIAKQQPSLDIDNIYEQLVGVAL